MKGNTVIFVSASSCEGRVHSQRQREIKASGKVKVIELDFLGETCRDIFCISFPTGLLAVLFLLSNKPF